MVIILVLPITVEFNLWQPITNELKIAQPITEEFVYISANQSDCEDFVSYIVQSWKLLNKTNLHLQKTKV